MSWVESLFSTPAFNHDDLTCCLHAVSHSQEMSVRPAPPAARVLVVLAIAYIVETTIL